MKDIIENNKLIAEFMGFKISNDYWIIPSSTLYLEQTNEVWYELKFHSSWDWLMLVVEKIEGLECVEEFKIKWDGVLQHQTCLIIAFKDTFSTINKVSTIKIEAVWLAVTEFVKWYNKNEKP